MSIAAKTEIHVRDMDFPFLKNQNIPKFWFDNDPWITNWYNVLSGIFPDGERFFVFSVNHFRDDLTDPVLIEEVKKFSGQEVRHSRDHHLMNEEIEKQHGVPIKRVETLIRHALSFLRDNLSNKFQLAITVGLEHLTAIASDALYLREPELMTKERVFLADLLIWHGIEEVEHKAVAFDVYKSVGGGYFMRCFALLVSTFFFAGFLFIYHIFFIHKQKQLFNLKSVWRFLRYQFGFSGVIWRMLPSFLAYFLPGFHPWQHDNSDSIKEYVERFRAQEITS